MAVGMITAKYVLVPTVAGFRLPCDAFECAGRRVPYAFLDIILVGERFDCGGGT